jgi:predicted ATP-dependent endonuclease of OLD family
MISRVTLKNFGPFKEAKLEFSDQINVFVGTNSTGKTFLLKLLYSVIQTLNLYGDLNKEKFGYELSKKLKDVFLVDKIGRLTTRIRGHKRTKIEILIDKNKILSLNFSTRHKDVKVNQKEGKNVEGAIYIPPKEIISILDRGLETVCEEGRLIFEGVYCDLAKKLNQALARGRYDDIITNLLQRLNIEFLNRIYRRDKEFFLYLKGLGQLESKLVAEGYRKLITLIYLIKVGEFEKSKYLFWDEPEANLNPSMVEKLIDIWLFLSNELKTQIFIATHDYFILKHLDLKKKQEGIRVKFIGLNLNWKDFSVSVNPSEEFYGIEPNPILDEFKKLYLKEFEGV